MYNYLDYNEILKISLLSRQFHDEGVEKYLPWSVRHRAVAQAESKSPLNGQRACYLCFRMKDPGQFHKSKRSSPMPSHARVIQRDVYTGQRVFESESETTLGLGSNSIMQQQQQLPPAPMSPVSPVSPISPIIGMGGLGMGINSYLFSAAMDSAAGVRTAGGSSMAGIEGLGGMGSMGYMADMGHMENMGNMSSLSVPTNVVVSPIVVHRRYQRWRPHAPGAEVGQVESFRSYCIQCALQTHLAVPGKLFESRTGLWMWVCSCRIAWSRDDVQRCPNCNRAAVYRDAVVR
ncbi:hypothetical protein SBRCBS47491_002612 [Sporothrix bragantina]|uniref:RING-type domain-containing protein n=1 Tax=Sporothrix bragantina TaxID=671064 RepID=A0ABP0B883_9PEZI